MYSDYFFLIFVYMYVHAMNICERADVDICSLNLSTVVQRTADVGSKFHCAMVHG